VLRSERLAHSVREVPRDPVVDLPLATIARSAKRLEADAEALANEIYELLRQVPEGETATERKKLLEEIATRVNSVRRAAADIAGLCGGSYARVTYFGTLLLF